MPDASQVATYVEIANQVPILGQASFNALKNIYSWIVIIPVLLWFYVNKDFSHITKRKENGEHENFNKISAYLVQLVNIHKEIPTTDVKITKKRNKDINTLLDTCDSYAFKLAKGIYAESDLRALLYSIHEKTNHTITWFTIKRALEFISGSETAPTIREFTGTEKFQIVINWLLGIIFVFFGLAIGIMVLASGIKTLFSFLIFATIPILCFSAGLYSFSQNWNYAAAMKIKHALNTSTSKSFYYWIL